MFSDLNLNIVVPMLSLGLFVFGFITFMIYHENRLKDLEDKAPDDHDISGTTHYSAPKR